MIRSYPLFLTLIACACALCGCRHASAPPQARTGSLPSVTRAGFPESLPIVLDRDHLTATLLDGLRKPIMGRRVSLREVERVARRMGPLVALAARQPGVDGPLARMAHDAGMTLEGARANWIALQEADLLLESGGDSDALSSAGAAGAAQWLPGTGRANGLPVELKESDRLTTKIAALDLRIAWMEYLTAVHMPALLPDLVGVPLAAALARLPALRREREMLRAKRRGVDARYDPRQAIFAQTRYLLRLYDRFPSADWLFQAYHGGEGGVRRLLRAYGGSAWSDCAAAVRFGNNGRPLRFEDIYFTVTPQTRVEAFSYLYGRGDDHRHYWWKLLAARAALELFRRDPGSFRKEWERLRPGRRIEAVWYPNGPAEKIGEPARLREACTDGRLAPVVSEPGLVVRPAPPNAGRYAALRPAAKGTLRLIADGNRRAGSSEPVRVGDMTLTNSYLALVRQAHPPKPSAGFPRPPDPNAFDLPGGGPPADFDYHVTGLVFDLLRPASSSNRKILEYVLGFYQDRGVLAWVEAKDLGERRYHVVPNPRYQFALDKIAAGLSAPAW